MKNIFLILISFGAFAQNPEVAIASKNTQIFTNATIHIGNGEICNNCNLIIGKGKIISVSNNSNFSEFANAEIINANGKQIYPGIISPNNTLGLVEIPSVRSTNDEGEIGEFNPNVRTLTSYNTDSEIIPTVRGNGILISQATPQGGIIAGRSSIFNLDGWNWEDAVLKKDDGIWINWPQKMDFSKITEIKPNEKYQENIDKLTLLFSQAQKTTDNINIKLSAVNSILKENMNVYVQFNTEKEGIEAMDFCLKNEIKNAVLVGELHSDLAISILEKSKFPILIPSTHRVPTNNDAPIWEAYLLPEKLIKKGILVGMFYNDSHWRTRNLGFTAGNAAGFGLSKSDALKMITYNNAKILGIDKWVGSLEKGKNATFVISNGDLLDMRTSKVDKVYINGAEVNMNNKQKTLANKYFKKYNIN